MRAWAAWVALTSRREPGTSLALVRLFVGLVVLFDLFRTWASGAMPLVWGDVRDTPDGFHKFGADGLFALLGDARWGTVQGVAAATAVAALLLAMGVLPRLMAFLTLQGCIALYDLNLPAGGGHDRLATNALWLLVLSDSGRTLSLACRLRTGRWTNATPVAAWPRMLMVAQLVVMYTSTGMQKTAPEWLPWGGWLAVHHMLLAPAWARWDLSGVLGPLGPVTRLATATTWLWECTFAAVVLGGPRVRLVWGALGVAFHVGLWVLTDLGPFSPMALALYPCLVPADAWRRLLGARAAG